MGIDALGSGSAVQDVQELQVYAARRGALTGSDLTSGPSRSMPEPPKVRENTFRDYLARSDGSALAAAIRGGPPKAQAWRCVCGAVQTGGKFCTQCGAPKPL